VEVLMKYEIPVYRDEIQHGLAHAIRTQASIAYLVPVLATDIKAQIDIVKAASYAESQSYGTYDLFYIRDLLVSTVHNLNDDVMLKEEVWPARHTSEDKPFNFNHDRNDIIGHITSCVAVDVDLNPLADDLAIEDVPDKFHIINSSVIYRNCGDPERIDLIEKTIAEILAGEWFVSMEAAFAGFDYKVTKPDGSSIIVARNQDTAWMTKYLRAYPPEQVSWLG
jgi:hypothetical protein